MPKITLAESIEFEVTIDEIVMTTRLILDSTQDAKVRKALKEMILELQKGHDVLLDSVLIPLFELESQEDFDRNFSQVYIDWKRIYLSHESFLARMNCHFVTKKLNELTQDQAWVKPIPFFNRYVNRMEGLTNAWITDDSLLYSADEKIRQELDSFLEDIRQMSDKEEAYGQLKFELGRIQEHYKALRKQSLEFEAISRAI